ncbi:MAG TPA: acyl-CoA carboxylase subunit beta [Gammaproteobacteria bacterium]|jgi:geranyl-CoA carboxylase beta subunit|nr:acyl-CoA carboxylase subunit beta [Gammaproteobacteria bacterium]RTZ64520.1 MAG: acyl-CoA carboxylase subunit beta [Gammaproteobacteria bacterium]HAD38309.1 acetyl-CoA carboxylase carboxyltransferase subunit [Gammaproteobacteria bacterium]HBK76401.1 acetyl-CoA carboxylase carboxyltransferase subunit [Gammaproteobacteria bacterium]HIM88425.1 acyl-CoA carboxylase subunit beta [Gammaproteobacteria bacterium]
MTQYRSRIDPASEGFAANREQMLALVEKLRSLETRAHDLSERRRPRFEERGQLTPRERLSGLLDPGLPFLELYNMANYLVDDQDPDSSIPGASMICGIGFVSGVRCTVFVDDSGINAGASTTTSVSKALGVLRVAQEQKLPLIHLVESAGANLMRYTVELWANGGGMFHGLARLSAAGIPTIVVLHGPSTAGGAYQPGMSDYVVGVKKNGMAALAGAALLKAATGEIAEDAQLGGSEMHASVSGLVEYLAEDDSHGLEIARDLIGRLDWNSACPRPEPRSFQEPVFSPDEIAGVVPLDYHKPYDVREVVARIVDGSDFVDFKPRYGVSTVCIQADIFGQSCGLVGNNGPIDPNGATKAAQFFQLCDQSNLPIIFLNNTTGYMVGTEYEHAGMIKHGSKMIQAVSNVKVPKISLYIGASFGAGNYGMCGYAYEPDFLFTWPNATTGVMGGEQAALTMEHVMINSARRRGKEIDTAALEAQKQAIIEHYDRQSDAFYTSGRLLDHGMVDPRDTRKVLGFALQTCWESRNRTLRPNSFGIARL